MRRQTIELFKKYESRPAVEIESRYSKLIISLWLIQVNLEESVYLINKAVTLEANEPYNVDEIIISALWHKAIAIYGKMFTKSTGRYSTLEVPPYILIDEDRRIHETRMNCRHNHVAHLDLNEFENLLLVAVLNKEDNARFFEYMFLQVNRTGHYLTESEIAPTIAFPKEYVRKLKKNYKRKLQNLIKRYGTFSSMLLINRGRCLNFDNHSCIGSGLG